MEEADKGLMMIGTGEWVNVSSWMMIRMVSECMFLLVPADRVVPNKGL